MGSTDFWSPSTLSSLQLPYVRRETTDRLSLISRQAVKDGLTVVGDEDELRHSAWLVTSRCLTVAGEEGSDEQRKVLIPYLDMINHDRSSNHVLTGRAAEGGWLRVVAGSDVKKGDQIFIRYGSGEGNDRMVQDYGFVDEKDGAMEAVARRIMEAGEGWEGSLKVREGGGKRLAKQ